MTLESHPGALRRARPGVALSGAEVVRGGRGPGGSGQCQMDLLPTIQAVKVNTQLGKSVQILLEPYEAGGTFKCRSVPKLGSDPAHCLLTFHLIATLLQEG